MSKDAEQFFYVYIGQSYIFCLKCLFKFIAQIFIIGLLAFFIIELSKFFIYFGSNSFAKYVCTTKLPQSMACLVTL